MENDAPSTTSNKQVILRRQNVEIHNIASACSTPPTTFMLPSMFNQRVCSDIHTAHHVANEKHETHTNGCKACRSLSMCLPVFLFFVRLLPFSWPVCMLLSRLKWRAQRFTYIQQNRFGVRLSSCCCCRWKILCVRFGNGNEDRKRRKWRKYRKNYRYTWDDAYIYDVL